MIDRPTFGEIEKFELTADQAEAFKRLKIHKDFIIFRDFVESEILLKVYALLVGTTREGIDRIEYLDNLRGFGRFWKSLMNRVDRKENEKID